MSIKIGIAGCGGFVGQAVYGSVNTEAKKDIVLYDPIKFPEESNWDDVLLCSHLFLCLPTPMRTDHDYGTQDFSIYIDVLGDLIKANYKGIVIIKSTVLYDNIAPFLSSKLNIVMNPEFLNARSAREDFQNQKLIILGGRIDHTESVENLYDECFILDCPEYLHCSHREAIEAKYFRKDLPDFNVGDTIKMMVKVAEADKVRLHPFEGTVIRKKGRGLKSTFTVRKISFGEGVERAFPLHSPAIDSLKVISRGTVRRSKLYYLRKRVGKKTRVKKDESL